MKKQGFPLELRLKALDDFSKDRRAKNYHVRFTSGTSGEPMLVARFRKLATGQEEPRIGTGLKAPILCWGQNNARVSLLGHFLFVYEEADRRALSLSEADLTETLEPALKEFAPDSLLGLPSFAAQVLLKINDKELLNSIKQLRLSGERVSKTQLEIFAAKVPQAEIKCWYASVEGGVISAASCGRLPLNCYHPARNMKVEINEPAADGTGEIIVSTNLSKSARLERYATGDLGRIIPERCACGEDLAFEVLGRKDFDYIKFLGATLRQEVFEAAIGRHPEIRDYRISVEEVLRGRELVGKVILKLLFAGKDKFEGRKEELRRSLESDIYLTPTRTFKDLVAAGKFLPLEIEAVDDFEPIIKNVKMRHRPYER